jgi:hypothetical protein
MKAGAAYLITMDASSLQPKQPESLPLSVRAALLIVLFAVIVGAGMAWIH